MSFGRKPFVFSLVAIAALISLDGVQAKTAARDDRPNIVLVIADDMGSGDLLSATNPLSQFPALSRIAEQGTRLRNFHVDPTCSPTRAALLTGQYSLRTGVWHTIMGRSILPTDRRTLAEVLRAAGYDTGLFGK
jgi:arylsulfatase A-like enzyme